MGKEHELLTALRSGNVDQARKIMAKLKKAGTKKRVNVNVQDETGFSALHHCAANGYEDLVKEIVEYGGIVMVGDNKGMSPLHIAAFGGQYEAALVLLMRHADPNAASRTGDTPLHLAAQYGHTRLVETLLDNRANCNLLNVSGQTPLDLACQHGHKDVLHLLLKSGQCQPRPGALQTPLHIAAKHGQVECLRLLIQYGYPVDTKGMSGTSLHEAALYGKVEVVRFLLEAGADVTALNGQGLTPLEVVNQYTDPRSSQELKRTLQEATYVAQRRLYYGHQQQQLQQQHQQQQQQHQQQHQQHHQQQQHRIQASPQQQAYYNQQQFNLLQQPTSHLAGRCGGEVMSHAGNMQAHPQWQQQQQPPSYVNMGPEVIDGQFVSRDRSPTVDAAMMGMRRGQRGAGIGGNPELAAQIASLATRRNSQKDMTPPTMGGEDFAPQQRSHRSYTVSAPHPVSSRHQQPAHHSSVHMGPPSFKPVPPPGEREREPDSAYSTLAKDSPLINEMREGLRMSRSSRSISPDTDNQPSDFAAMLQQGKGTLRRAGTVQEQTLNYPGMELAGVGSLGNMIAAGRTTLRHAQTETQEAQPVAQQANHTAFTAMIQQSKGTLKRKKTYQEKPKPEESDVSDELKAKLLRRQQKVVEGEKEAEEGSSHEPTKDDTASEPPPAMVRRNSKSQTPPPVAAKNVVQQPQPAAPQQAQPPPSRTEASIFAHTQAAKKSAPAPPPRSTPLLNEGEEQKPSSQSTQEVAHEFQQVVLRSAKNSQGSSPSLQASASDASVPPVQGSPPTENKVPPPVASKQTAERPPAVQEANPAAVPSASQATVPSRTNASIFDMTQKTHPSDSAQRSSLELAAANAPVDETALFTQVRLRKVSDSARTSQASAKEEQQPTTSSVDPPTTATEKGKGPAAEPTPRVQEASVSSREAVSIFSQVKRSSLTKDPSPPVPQQPAAESGPPTRGQLSMFSTSKQASQGQLRTVAIPTQKSRPPRQRSPPRTTQPAVESTPTPAVVDPPPAAEVPPTATAAQPSTAAAPPPTVAKLPPAVANLPPAASVPPRAAAAPPPTEVVLTPPVTALPPAAAAQPPPVTAPPPAATAPPSVVEPVQPIPMVPPPKEPPRVATHTPADLPPTPISEWLASIKLVDYIDLLQGAGYDTTDFLIGITADDLIQLGMSKIGHRKRLLTALQSLPAEDRQPKYKPVHVSAWLSEIGLQQYEGVLVEAGYDEIEYLTDITEEELNEVGVTKQGHVKKFVRSLAVLGKLSEAPHSSTPPVPPTSTTSSVPQSLSIPAVSTIQPPPLSKDDSPVPPGGDKTRQLMEAHRMTAMSQTSSSSSLDRDEAYGSEDSFARSVSSNDQVEVGGPARKKLPPLVPSRSPATILSPSTEEGVTDKFTMNDITGVLDNALGAMSRKEPAPQDLGESGSTDALMCELDDMLANLSTQLDIIIPEKRPQ